MGAAGAREAAHAPADDRSTARLGPLALEGGAVVEDLVMAWESWGPPPREAEGCVLVVHALTGDSHVAGAAGPHHPTPGWWPGMVGPGAPLDTDRFHVVAPNVLGGCRGSTGPASTGPDGRVLGSRLPRVSVRDQVAAEAALADHLGITSWHLVVGASMGGMRALEWAATHPGRVERLMAVATGARATADQIAWWSMEQAAITADPAWQGGDYPREPGRRPDTGLGLARRIAHTTYRSATELEVRFGSRPQGAEDPATGGRFAVESYLDHAADKLVARFDAGSYVCLSRSMQSQDVGRGRGGVASALARVGATARVVAIDSDRLFPPALSEEVAEHLPGAGGVDLLSSPHGHDGFLVEADVVGAIARELVAAPGGAGAPGLSPADPPAPAAGRAPGVTTPSRTRGAAAGR